MLRFLTSGLREEPHPPATAEQPLASAPEPPHSPRLQVEHARRLEEDVAILRAELAEARGAHEAKLADQAAKHAARLAAQRDKYESRARRLEARNAWLEDAVRQLADEKAWLARRNDALERTEKRLDARVGALEEEVFELKAENEALRVENEDFKVDHDDMAGAFAALQRAAEEMAQNAHRALTKPKAKSVRGRGEGEEEEGGEQRTPRGKRIEAPDDGLSGETLRERNDGEDRGRPSADAQAGGGVDPRSVEALRTLGSSRNVSPSPTPDRGRQRRLGGGGVTAGGGSNVADASSENVTIRPSRKRQRAGSDTD